MKHTLLLVTFGEQMCTCGVRVGNISIPPQPNSLSPQHQTWTLFLSFFFFLNINTDTGGQRRQARPAAPAGRASRALKGVFSILKELPRVSLLAPCRLFLYSYIFIDDLLF